MIDIPTALVSGWAALVAAGFDAGVMMVVAALIFASVFARYEWKRWHDAAS